MHTNIHTYVDVRTYLTVYMHICVCKLDYAYVRTIRTYVCIIKFTYICRYVCMFMCLYICTYIHTYVCKHLQKQEKNVNTCVRMYVCMYVQYICIHNKRMCVRTYMYLRTIHKVHMYVCKHTLFDIFSSFLFLLFLDGGGRLWSQT